MAGKTINITPLKQLIRLYTNGVSLNTIVKSVAVARNTVRKYHRLIAAKQLHFSDLLALNDLAMESLLKKESNCNCLRYR
jgi:uncharacterized protein YaaW (UPF0174 family)